MATYILVHGAWHGAWCWNLICPLLAPHRVIAVDLPGRTTKQPPETITLKTHVDFVLSTIREQSEPVILVGHSMGGMIISQVAEHIPAQIAHLIYVAGFVPNNAETLLDIAQRFEGPGISPEMIWDEAAQHVDLRRNAAVKDLFMNRCDPLLADHALAHLQAEPMQPFFDQVHLRADHFGSVSKHYILCAADKTISAYDQQCLAKKADCDIHTLLEADHAPFYSTPQDLATTLLAIA